VIKTAIWFLLHSINSFLVKWDCI